MKVYEFAVRVIGMGHTPEEAWEDLLSEGTFHFDDGNYSIPEPEDIKILEENEEE
jgi:hypothetical protein